MYFSKRKWIVECHGYVYSNYIRVYTNKDKTKYHDFEYNITEANTLYNQDEYQEISSKGKTTYTH